MYWESNVVFGVKKLVVLKVSIHDLATAKMWY